MFNPFPNKPWFLRFCSTQSFENTVGKGEIARNEFSTHLENFLPFSSNLKLSSANTFSLEASKICCLGKGENGAKHHTNNQSSTNTIDFKDRVTNRLV